MVGSMIHREARTQALPYPAMILVLGILGRPLLSGVGSAPLRDWLPNSRGKPKLWHFGCEYIYLYYSFFDLPSKYSVTMMLPLLLRLVLYCAATTSFFCSDCYWCLLYCMSLLSCATVVSFSSTSLPYATLCRCTAAAAAAVVVSR